MPLQNLCVEKKLSGYRIDGNKVYFGKVPWKKSFEQARQLEVDNNRTASQLSAKLQCFRWIQILKSLEDKRQLEMNLRELKKYE